MQHPEWILILDFGSQYTQLIARRLREFNVYCEIYPFNHNLEDFSSHKPNGVVLSGGPRSVYDTDAPYLNTTIFDWNIPVLGICRGMQFINVYFGGKLIRTNKEKHVAVNHDVNIIDENLKLLIGEKMNINSYHNFGVEKSVLAEKLKVFAETAHGVIEGIYNPHLPIIGIEWHPERENLAQEVNDKLIKEFLKGDLFWKK